MLRTAFAFATVLLALSVTEAPALERATARLGADAHESWSRSDTQTIRYYNLCTGWVWVWTLNRKSERMGEVFQAPSSGALGTSWTLTYYGAPCGYGYEGTIAVHAVDANDCPVDPPLRKMLFCIPPQSGWQATNWSGLQVPSRFAIVVSSSPYWSFLDGAVASDKPAPGPTGPIGCGTCFPTTRTTHSYYWGVATSPLCPGELMFDGFCNAELAIDVTVSSPTALESRSWGRIKGLYR